jgi:hypothetical protein
MKIAKSQVVNLFIILGCPKAAKWSDEYLAGRVAYVHELFEPGMEIDARYRQLFALVYEAGQAGDSVEIFDDSGDPVEQIISNIDLNLTIEANRANEVAVVNVDVPDAVKSSTAESFDTRFESAMELAEQLGFIEVDESNEEELEEAELEETPQEEAELEEAELEETPQEEAELEVTPQEVTPQEVTDAVDGESVEVYSQEIAVESDVDGQVIAGFDAVGLQEIAANGSVKAVQKEIVQEATVQEAAVEDTKLSDSPDIQDILGVLDESDSGLANELRYVASVIDKESERIVKAKQRAEEKAQRREAEREAAKLAKEAKKAAAKEAKEAESMPKVCGT